MTLVSKLADVARSIPRLAVGVETLNRNIERLDTVRPLRLTWVERTVTDPAECDFYHAMDLPGIDPATTQWDLRQSTHQYLGEADFAGKRVIEIGPASGYLSLWMEEQGASVVGIEPPLDSFWDLVPQHDLDMTDRAKRFRGHIQRIRNSFWYCHAKKKSRVRIAETDSYALPAELGRFDIGLLASVLLHTRSPVGIMESVARLVDGEMIVSERYYPELGDGPVCQLEPSGDHKTTNTWWRFTPAFFINMLAVLGFTEARVVRHNQIYIPTNDVFEMFTVVARRPGARA